MDSNRVEGAAQGKQPVNAIEERYVYKSNLISNSSTNLSATHQYPPHLDAMDVAHRSSISMIL